MKPYTEEQIQTLKKKPATQFDISNILLTFKQIKHEVSSNLELVVSETNKINERNEDEHSSIVNQLNSVLNKINLIEGVLIDNKSAFKDLENKIAELKNSKNSIFDQIKQLQTDNKKLTAEHNANKTVINKIDSNHSEFKSKLENVNRELNSIEQKQISLSNEIEKEKKRTKDSLDVFSLQIESSKKDLNTIRNNVEIQLEKVRTDFKKLSKRTSMFYWINLPLIGLIIYLLLKS